MPHASIRFSLTAGLLLLAGVIQAQTTFRIGPQVSLNWSNASYFNDSYRPSARAGFEAGVLGSLDLGHVSLQPALLYSQKGYYLTSGTDQTTGINNDNFRLNYLTLPVKVVYARADGQGVQVLAGAYLGLLLGGRYERAFTHNNSTTVTTGSIIPNQTPLSYEEYSSRRLDAGFLVGVGYRYKRVQVQANYSWGGTNLAVSYQFKGVNYENPFYRNQAVQVSLACLFNAKS
ncbi:outer membrane beta-barrel protein [Hymenobacter convexus]|uniref:outer membrane beta-barrel protein n=1 Tax=Hymenobacter sp. CA1UV-4 TaxID=3063782 RepID=UPI002712C4D9|nr:outer membrane beta-barrel protein [Hymenobacter sp. CA1UV-4]MDO7854179.1 outer membrane beta-barrel protein [Hymenobacter sp. CA1UV-4]